MVATLWLSLERLSFTKHEGHRVHASGTYRFAPIKFTEWWLWRPLTMLRALLDRVPTKRQLLGGDPTSLVPVIAPIVPNAVASRNCTMLAVRVSIVT